MRFYQRVIEAFRRASEEAALARVERNILDDPLSIQMIEKIAKEYDYHFEIVRRDGTVLRFHKRGAGGSADSDRDVW